MMENIKYWDEVKDYFFITLGIMLYTISFTVFLMPYQIVAGGVTGLSAIIYYATGFHVQNTYIIINLSLLVVALKVLGFKFLFKTIYAIFLLYFLLIVAQDIIPKQPNGMPIKLLGEGQDFMSMIIGCVITGVALSTVFLHNGSTGGTDIIAASVNKYHNVSLGVMTLENFSLDYIMNARRESVQFMIFSRKYQEIANAIGMETGHGVTILDGHGWYTGQEVKVLCILAKKRESTDIFRLIKLIDPNAFVSQSSVVGVYGEGFDEMKVSVKKKLEANRKKNIQA